MRYLLTALILLFGASVANAATTFHFTDGGGAQTQDVDFDGNSNGLFAEGLSANIEMSLVSVDDTTWTFDVTATNTTDGDLWDAARLVIFGFNVSGDEANLGITSGSVSGDWNGFGSGNMPNGLPAVEGCANAKDGETNCSGGGSGGAGIGEVNSFQIVLTLDGETDNLWFDGLAVRYQSLAGEICDEIRCSGSGTGTPTIIPEPATWLMMILGFGMIGLQLKRRDRTVASMV